MIVIPVYNMIVAPEVKDKIEIVPVSKITEILAKTGVIYESHEEAAVNS